MRKIGVLVEPYLLQKSSSACTVEWQDQPHVEYPDVYNYLIETPTGKSLKAYTCKSLEAYNFYVNGWVENINIIPSPTSGDLQSQRLSQPPTKP